MSLNHVSYWENRDWHHISAMEAAKKSNGHPIKASEQKLLCDLCSHFISLCVGKKISPYFKHSRGDFYKYCPERTVLKYKSSPFSIPKHFAGLRIVIDKNQHFHFELLIPKAANPELSKNKRLNVYRNNHHKVDQVKVAADSFFTKVNLGNTIDNRYAVYNDSSSNAKQIANFQIPKLNCLIFRENDGMRVSLGSELNPNNEYLVLTRGDFKYSGIQKQRLARSNGWNLYRIGFSTNVNSKTVNDFFQMETIDNEPIGYRITKNTAGIDLIWPEHFKTKDGINYLGDTLYLYKHGQGWFDHAPKTESHQSFDAEAFLQSFEDSQLLALKTGDNGMVVAYGRSFIDIANYKQFIPSSTIADDEDRKLLLKPYTKNNHLYVKPVYNATLKQYVDKFEIKTSFLAAGKEYPLPELKAGTSLKIYYGADCVFSKNASIPNHESLKPLPSSNIQNKYDDAGLLNLLRQQIGDSKPFVIVANQLKQALKHYPNTYAWVCTQARQKAINIKAFNILNKIVNGEYY